MADRPSDRSDEVPAVPDEDRWNHNIEYQSELLRRIPVGVRRALDVGCGDGQLTRRLATIAGVAIGIDPDQPSLASAAAQSAGTDARYVLGDIRTAPFPAESFDAVVCVMALHHLNTEVGLRALAALVAPGGTLGVIGCGRSNLPWDLPYQLAGAVSTRLHQRAKGLWEQTSPMVWPPPDSYAETRRTAERLLPGCTFERKVLWRYILTWTKPDR
jgi:SAM-dependent methyltransferase